ncbi:hypothetical protein HX41_003032 [Salmonella enterica subsp. enterica]|nr:hypothetical protein [Salmonella enterica subsp. salamae]EDV4561831.1 hypothetical protein [Salmonella enterica subsp. enterica]
MVVSDLKERIAYDDKPSLHRAEASTVLDELPHLKATLSDYDYQVIARMVAQAKVKSLQNTRAIILGGDADWLTTSPVSSRETSRSDVHFLLDMINKYQTENASKEHSQKSQDKYAHSLALTFSFFGNVPISEISLSSGREFRELLASLPEKLKAKEMLETPLLELISKKKASKTIATATANDHLEKVRRFFQWMLDTGCPNLMNGTLHLNHTWDDGYLTADGVGTLALQSYEQIDSEGAILTFSNGNVRAKILPKVQNNLIQFFLWDKDNWHPCSYK